MRTFPRTKQTVTVGMAVTSHHPTDPYLRELLHTVLTSIDAVRRDVGRRWAPPAYTTLPRAHAYSPDLCQARGASWCSPWSPAFPPPPPPWASPPTLFGGYPAFLTLDSW